MLKCFLFIFMPPCENSSKHDRNTHSTDKAVCMPLLAQCRDELFADWMSTTSASWSKQLIIVVSVALHE